MRVNFANGARFRPLTIAGGTRGAGADDRGVDAGRRAGLTPTPLDLLLGPAIGQRTRAALAASPVELRAALILGSPDFMRGG